MRRETKKGSISKTPADNYPHVWEFSIKLFLVDLEILTAIIKECRLTSSSLYVEVEQINDMGSRCMSHALGPPQVNVRSDSWLISLLFLYFSLMRNQY